MLVNVSLPTRCNDAFVLLCFRCNSGILITFYCSALIPSNSCINYATKPLHSVLFSCAVVQIEHYCFIVGSQSIARDSTNCGMLLIIFQLPPTYLKRFLFDNSFCFISVTGLFHSSLSFVITVIVCRR